VARYRRNPSTLADLGASWIEVVSGRGTLAAAGLTSFLRGRTPHTQRSYQFAVLDLWHWLVARRGRVVLPDEVSADDVQAYTAHLQERRDGGVQRKLQDGRDEHARIYRFLLDHPHRDASTIASSLGIYDRARLQGQLDALVRQLVLERAPRHHQLRQQPDRKRLDVPIDPAIFRYSVKLQPAPALATVLTRLRALDSFWHELSLVKAVITNPWTAAIRPLALRAAQERTASAPRRMPAEMARRLWDAASGDSLLAVRDRALLALLTLPDLTVQELVALRREHWQGDRLQAAEGTAITLPAVARAALEALSTKLSVLEQERVTRGKDVRGWLEPDAPLVPAIGQWGAHAERDPLRSMRPYAVTAALHTLAERVGIARGSAEFKLVHAAALRHVVLQPSEDVAA
jgi:hypothetical protein